MIHYFRLLNIRLLVLVFLSLHASITLAQTDLPTQSAALKFMPPKRIQANYDVMKNGKPFAKVYELFVLADNAYKVESVTKGIGVYALLGERKLTSTGVLTAQGLKPNHFELHQGDNPKKALFADFDWESNTLHMLVKGKVNDVSLAQGSQDLASYAYQFMFLSAPLNDAITVTLTTGKKLNQYTYQINTDQEALALTADSGAIIQYKTVHLQLDQVKPQSESKELWLASERYYLPVRILIVDENGEKIEQTLTDLHVE